MINILSAFYGNDDNKINCTDIIRKNLNKLKKQFNSDK